ncbi:DUF6361 family protein [Mesorhizobium sp.]|uniref:DUF6361 family protein n=1 Tax=Mesorhizobium sp. TaxID=1871066 RepID=UPI000FE3104A|nr:DUF6361 family protein [Mesorhizobium sp.]RWH65774.1 MAG: hypothetical protein EOQ84_32245 [Mesorhizobium sp.]RWL19842.1 MAG: hypothetical protein EOR58_31925 [Mesorhizobium sp.]RWL23425.1 MAG: hypothetical protein EOR63_32165 [Mesorhizobium sp.]RWL31063.1 MAG: hypothetical protein EOR59_28255 [Mesorhizobium sp.]RWL44040.1 MAG: hypothetical protein EOR61_30375 [Mesorhizobium sp.]
MRGNAPIEPSLGWTYLSRLALARAKAQMDEESTGVRDEIGFLTIHQRYADRFFPGTSVLHTRARYAIFVPWLFEDLAGLMGPAAVRALRERERELAGRLKNAGESQVIGGRVFPKASSQPPSTVYWNALAVWGILRSRADGRIISRSQAHRQLKGTGAAIDDDGQPLLSPEPPFLPLPERPGSWRSGPITLRLTSNEASFLREHLGQLRPIGGKELSLLARLVRAGIGAPSGMWAAETRALAGPDQFALGRAEQVASLAGIGRAVYDALLEHTLEAVDKRETSTRHRNHLTVIVKELGPVAADLDVNGLEDDIGALPVKLRAVVTATKDWIASKTQDPVPLLDIYTAAEARKGPRARLAPTPNGRARRLEWSSDEHGLATPLHYRWSQVSTLLNDLVDAE